MEEERSFTTLAAAAVLLKQYQVYGIHLHLIYVKVYVVCLPTLKTFLV